MLPLSEAKKEVKTQNGGSLFLWNFSCCHSLKTEEINMEKLQDFQATILRFLKIGRQKYAKEKIVTSLSAVLVTHVPQKD